MSGKTFVIVLFGLLAANARADETGVVADPEARESAQLLKAVLDGDAAADEQRADRLKSAAEKVANQLGKHHLATQMLRSGIEQKEKPDEFRSIVEDVYTMLTFEPVVEAEMPEGFPSPTPVGKVELKQYPAYRRAKCAKEGDSGFFTLFRHITANKIEMTAPVEMGYQLDDEKQPRATSMAFLYASTETGSVGQQPGDVAVEDVPAQTVLSVGMRGATSTQQIEEARRALSDWLNENAARYEPAGALRVMGYNSPFVPINRRYFEVQIPLRTNEDSCDGACGTARPLD